MLKNLSRPSNDLIKGEILEADRLRGQVRNCKHFLTEHLNAVRCFLKIAKNLELSRNTNIFEIKTDQLTYCKSEVDKYVIYLWKRRITYSSQALGVQPTNDLQLSLKPYNLHLEKYERKLETKTLNLLLGRGCRAFYKTVGLTECESCACGVDSQTPEHLIFYCNLIDYNTRAELKNIVCSHQVKSIYHYRNDRAKELLNIIVEELIHRNIV